MIWGNENPKFVLSGSEICLDHSIITKDEPELDLVVKTSVITGKKNFLPKGYYWHFELRMHLFKYSDPIAKFNEIYAGLNQIGYLYRHKDGQPIKDSGANLVPFIMTEVIPFYLTNTDFKDGVIVKFQSQTYVNIQKSLITNEVITEDGNSLKTEDGNQIILEGNVP